MQHPTADLASVNVVTADLPGTFLLQIGQEERKDRRQPRPQWAKAKEPARRRVLAWMTELIIKLEKGRIRKKIMRSPRLGLLVAGLEWRRADGSQATPQAAHPRRRPLDNRQHPDQVAHMYPAKGLHRSARQRPGLRGADGGGASSSISTPFLVERSYQEHPSH